MFRIAALGLLALLPRASHADNNSKILSANVSPDFVAWSQGGVVSVELRLTFDLTPAGQCNYTVRWGDNQPPLHLDSLTTHLSHQYTTPYPARRQDFYIGVFPTSGLLTWCSGHYNMKVAVQPVGTPPPPPPPPKKFKHASAERYSDGQVQPKPDAAGCGDYPAFGRLQNYWIESCSIKPSGDYNFDLGSRRSLVSGKFSYIRYQPPTGLAAAPRTEEVLRDASALVEKAGGQVVASDSSKRTLKVGETWVEVWADHTGKYILTIVEK